MRFLGIGAPAALDFEAFGFERRRRALVLGPGLTIDRQRITIDDRQEAKAR